MPAAREWSSRSCERIGSNPRMNFQSTYDNRINWSSNWTGPSRPPPWQDRNRIYTETHEPQSARSKAHMPNLARMILLCLRQRCSPQTTISCSLWTPEKLPVQPKAEQSLGSPETVQLQAMVMLKEYHDLQNQMLVPQKIYLPGWAPSSAPWSGGTEKKL